MPAPTDTRADDAQYDNLLRGDVLHTDGPLAAGVPTADDEIIADGGQAGRPSTAWMAPGAAASSGFPSIFRAVWLKRAFACIPGSQLALKTSDNAGNSAGLADAGDLSRVFPRRDGRRATKEGNKR